MKSRNNLPLIILCAFSLTFFQGCSLLASKLMDNASMNGDSRDANPVDNGYVKLKGSFNNFDSFNTHSFDLLGEAPITDRIAVGTALRYQGIEFDNFNISESGIADIPIWLNYHVIKSDDYVVDVGAWGELPIGSEEVRGGQFDYGFTVSGRYKVSNEFILHGNIGYDFLDVDIPQVDENDNILRGGIGGIYSASDKINIFAEVDLQEETRFRPRFFDYPFIKGGLGISITKQIFGRAVFGTGLNEQGPDTFFELQLRTGLDF